MNKLGGIFIANLTTPFSHSVKGVAVKYTNKYTNLRKLKVYRSKLFTIYTKMKYFNFHPYLTYIGRALVKNVKSDLPYKVKKKNSLISIFLVSNEAPLID